MGDGDAVQRCKSERSSCAKVETWMTKTGRGSTTCCPSCILGRGVASPRPPLPGVQGKALPLPAGEARVLGWHAVPTLPRYRTTLPEVGVRMSIGERTRRSRAPTRCRVKGGAGDREVGRRAVPAAQPLAHVSPHRFRSRSVICTPNSVISFGATPCPPCKQIPTRVWCLAKPALTSPSISQIFWG
jgi:hypothetical protein